METDKKIIQAITADVKVLLANVAFRRILQYIITMRPVDIAEPDSTNATFFKLGQDSIIKAITSLVKSADRSMLFRMEDEYISFCHSYDEMRRKEIEDRLK